MMDWLREFKWLVSKKNRWGGYCVLHFRLAHWCSQGWHKYLGFPIVLYYHLFRHITGFDVHEKAEIGYFFNPLHCVGMVINPDVKIGNYFTFGHNSTLGKKNGKSPVIGNHVSVSPQCSVIGDIFIADNAVVGIGSVVLKNVPENAIVAGNPAKILKIK